MERTKKWSLAKEKPKRLFSLIGGNCLSNLPLGTFKGVIYLFIINLSIPIITNTNINYSLLWKYFIFYCAAFVAYVALSMWSQTNNFVQSYYISTDVRLKLGDKLRKLSLGFFKQHDPGDVTSRILHDVTKAEMNLSHTLPDMISALIIPIMLGGFLITVSITLSTVLFAAFLIALIFLYVSQKIITNLGKKHIKAITDTSSRVLEYCDTMKLLKAHDMTGESFTTMKTSMKSLKKLSFKAEVYAGIPAQIFLFTLDMGYLFMLSLGVWLCFNNKISVPTYFSFIILGYYFYQPIKNAGIKFLLLRYAGLSFNRIGEIFQTKEPVYNKDEILPHDNNIELNNIDFGYKSSNIINDLNCNITEKSLTALVGPSGSGKTTLTNLIARFWDVEKGKIQIGGKDLKDINPDELLTKISMVFQDVFLFNDTIANNIRIGKNDATEREIIEVAKLAKCHDFIEALPDGYNTIIGEGGNTLSGGEKQRISIARAILKDAPIIMLDEATASLDPENEADIQIAIENLIKNKTVIVIAHQFKSIVNADQILVLDNGSLIDKGTHEELIGKEGLYKSLWDKQLKARGWKISNN